MNRLLALLLAATFSALAAGTLHYQARLVRASASSFGAEEHAAAGSLAALRSAQPALEQTLSRQKPKSANLSPASLDPQLAAWLLRNDYGSIPDGLLPKLSAALGLQWAEPTNYVLVAKSSLPKINVCYNAGTNLLGDWDCGILAIAPGERQQIESACATARAQFVAWANANLRRETPGGNVLVRYTIPASAEMAQALTGSFRSAINGVIGPERLGLLWKYKQWWFDHELGHFGSVANTLDLMRDPFHPEQNDLWYSAEGHAGPIAEESCPGTFRNLLGGWPEILAREGMEIPKKLANPSGT